MTPVKSHINVSRKDELNSMLKKLETLKTVFITDTSEFLQEFWKEKANEFSKFHFEISDNLSDEQKSRFQSDLKSLCSNSIINATSILNKEGIWWHENPTKNSNYDRYKSVDNLNSKELRHGLGEIGKLLYKYGYIGVTDKPYFGFTYLKNPNGQYDFEFTNPVYWSEKMKRTLDQYWEYYKYSINLID